MSGELHDSSEAKNYSFNGASLEALRKNINNTSDINRLISYLIEITEAIRVDEFNVQLADLATFTKQKINARIQEINDTEGMQAASITEAERARSEKARIKMAHVVLSPKLFNGQDPELENNIRNMLKLFPEG